MRELDEWIHSSDGSGCGVSYGDLYAHTKEKNTFWSIFVVAALMGIVTIGQQW